MTSPESGEPLEVWRPIPEWEQFYEASSCGRIRRIGPKHSIGRGKSSGVLTPWKASFGYLYVGLFRHGKRTKSSVHRLVAAAFLGRLPRGLNTNHKNGDKSDNAPDNLEYITAGENIKHAFRLGLNRGSSKVTLEVLSTIRARLAASPPRGTQSAIAREYGLSVSYVSAVAKNQVRRNGF